MCTRTYDQSVQRLVFDTTLVRQSRISHKFLWTRFERTMNCGMRWDFGGRCFPKATNIGEQSHTTIEEDLEQMNIAGTDSPMLMRARARQTGLKREKTRREPAKQDSSSRTKAAPPINFVFLSDQGKERPYSGDRMQAASQSLPEQHHSWSRWRDPAG